MSIKFRLIATAAAIISMTGTFAAASNNDNSYLPPQTSHHRAKVPARKGATEPVKQRGHRVRAKTHHKRWAETPARVWADGSRYRQANRDDSAEDVLLLLPRLIIGILD